MWPLHEWRGCDSYPSVWCTNRTRCAFYALGCTVGGMVYCGMVASLSFYVPLLVCALSGITVKIHTSVPASMGTSCSLCETTVAELPPLGDDFDFSNTSDSSGVSAREVVDSGDQRRVVDQPPPYFSLRPFHDDRYPEEDHSMRVYFSTSVKPTSMEDSHRGGCSSSAASNPLVSVGDGASRSSHLAPQRECTVAHSV